MVQPAKQLGTTLSEGGGDGARGPRRSRRLKNLRVRESGYVFRRPNYRSGYAELLQRAEF